MKLRIFLTTLCFLTFLSVQAQEEISKIKYATIFEAGFMTTSPQGVGMEMVSIHGIAINKKHVLGIGFGIGANYNNNFYSAVYTPIFANYRHYFKPDNRFSPHITAALGGIITGDYGGFYSSFTAGFRVKKFSFSSGISFMPLKDSGYDYYDYYDPYYGYYTSYGYYTEKWYFPFGVVIKVGFSF
jgi:hypothetical protein